MDYVLQRLLCIFWLDYILYNNYYTQSDNPYLGQAILRKYALAHNHTIHVLIYIL